MAGTHHPVQEDRHQVRLFYRLFQGDQAHPSLLQHPIPKLLFDLLHQLDLDDPVHLDDLRDLVFLAVQWVQVVPTPP